MSRAEARALLAYRGEGDPNCTECKGSGASDFDDGVPTICECSRCNECDLSVFDDIDGFALTPADARGKRLCVECANEAVAEYLRNGCTANEVLAQLGLTHRSRGTNKHEFLRSDRVVFVGTIFAMNDWLARGGDWAVAS